MEIEFQERGNGFPSDGDILVDHEEQTAYRVLPDEPGMGQGNIETHSPGTGNTTTLNVEVVDYDDFCDSHDVWEI